MEACLVNVIQLVLNIRIVVRIIHLFAVVVMDDVLPDMIHHFLVNVMTNVYNTKTAATISRMFVKATQSLMPT